MDKRRTRRDEYMDAVMSKLKFNLINELIVSQLNLLIESLIAETDALIIV